MLAVGRLQKRERKRVDEVLTLRRTANRLGGSAENHLVVRVRRILGVEERSMEMKMSRSILPMLVVVFLLRAFLIGTYAQQVETRAHQKIGSGPVARLPAPNPPAGCAERRCADDKLMSIHFLSRKCTATNYVPPRWAISPPESIAGELPKRAEERSTRTGFISGCRPAPPRHGERPADLVEPRLDLRLAQAHRRE